MQRLARKAVWGVACLAAVACTEPERYEIPSLTAPSTVRYAAQVRDTPQILLLVKSQSNPFFAAIENGARQAQQALGAELVMKAISVELSVDQQIQMVSDAVTKQPIDAIVISPSDSRQLVPALVAAQKAGVRVVNIDTRLDAAAVAAAGGEPIPFVGIDNREASYQATRQLVAGLPRGAAVAMIEGASQADNLRQRSEGALRAFAEAGVRVVARPQIWNLDAVYTQTGQLLRAHPGIRAIYCPSDVVALGVLRYLSDNAIKGVRVSGFDGIDPARAALRAGRLTVSVDQRPQLQGYTGVKLALDLIAGKTVAAASVVPTRLLTAGVQEAAP